MSDEIFPLAPDGEPWTEGKLNATTFGFRTILELTIAPDGWIAADRVAVVNPFDWHREQNPLLGQIVRVGSAHFRVTGVESHAIPVIRKGAAIVLRVEAV